jgi:anthranilate phosphoribosyltransferase
MPKQISLELKDEDVEAYKELKQYVESKYGKIKGVIGEELAKAIRFYLQQLKASEGAITTPQQKPITEKAKEIKPIKPTKTTEITKQEIESLTKRIEDLESLKQKVEDLSKELKATEETVKNIFDAVRRLTLFISYCETDTVEEACKCYKSIMKEELPKDMKKRLERAYEEAFAKRLEEMTKATEDIPKMFEEIMKKPKEQHD